MTGTEGEGREPALEWGRGPREGTRNRNGGGELEEFHRDVIQGKHQNEGDTCSWRRGGEWNSIKGQENEVTKGSERREKRMERKGDQ